MLKYKMEIRITVIKIESPTCFDLINHSCFICLTSKSKTHNIPLFNDLDLDPGMWTLSPTQLSFPSFRITGHDCEHTKRIENGETFVPKLIP